MTEGFSQVGGPSGPQELPQEGPKSEQAPQVGSDLAHTYTVQQQSEGGIPSSVTQVFKEMRSETSSMKAEKKMEQLAEKVGRSEDRAAEAERTAGGSEDIIPMFLFLKALYPDQMEVTGEIIVEEEEEEEEEEKEEKEKEQEEKQDKEN